MARDRRRFGDERGRWLAACLIGLIAIGLFYADASGRPALVALLTMMVGRVFLGRRQSGRASTGMVVNLVITGLTAVGLALMAMDHPTGLWAAPLSGAVLALATTFVVGDRRDVRRRWRWRRYIGYALAALVSAAVGSNLFDHPGNFVFPFGALVLVFYCGPGAVIGGGLGWMLQMVVE